MPRTRRTPVQPEMKEQRRILPVQKVLCLTMGQEQKAVRQQAKMRQAQRTRYRKAARIRTERLFRQVTVQMQEEVKAAHPIAAEAVSSILA